jgi:hypothetical protein
MRPNRPTSVLVIAIFHFIFGGLGLLCGLPGLVMQGSGIGNAGAGPLPASATQQQKELHEMQVRVKQRTEQAAPATAPFLQINVVLNLLISLLLVVAGFGLVKMQLWGWWGSVVYGVVRIIMQIYILLFNLLYSLPIGGRILEEELKSQPTLQPYAWIFQIVTPLAIGVAALGLIYPIIVLIVMSRPKVRAAFRGETADAGRTDDFDDDRMERRGGREDEYDDELRDQGGAPDDRFGPAR